MTPALGTSAPQTGASYVCLDAGPLINFNDIQAVDRLGSWLAPLAYTPEAVIKMELNKRPRQNAPVIAAPWLLWVPSHPDDAELVAKLLNRFGKSYPENLGEAETIAASKRHGWTAVLDDEEGRLAAGDHGVPSVYTATLLAAAAAEGKVTPTQAWQMHVQIENNRGRYSCLKPDADNKPVFVDFCSKLRQLHKNAGQPAWPQFLAEPQLDALLLWLIEQARP